MIAPASNGMRNRESISSMQTSAATILFTVQPSFFHFAGFPAQDDGMILKAHKQHHVKDWPYGMGQFVYDMRMDRYLILNMPSTVLFADSPMGVRLRNSNVLSNHIIVLWNNNLTIICHNDIMARRYGAFVSQIVYRTMVCLSCDI